MSRNTPPPAALLLCAYQQCGEPFARLYFCGLRCTYHAPREAQIRAHASEVYRHNERLRRGAA